MFIAGAKYLESKKDYVDELNVFPVPDGDTGTNMSLTILAAAKEVEKADANNMAAIAKAISSGSLRGARGNSGVILSQLFRGFAKEVGKHEALDTVILANAMQRGVETAYKAVMKPKEGTILTVARGAADKAAELAVENNDITSVLKEVIVHANHVLDQTPDMLPVLKEAGVVDAGGQGLIYVLMGALRVLEDGENFVMEFIADKTETKDVEVKLIQSSEDIKFGYCTEFIVDTGDKHTLEQNEAYAIELKNYLETIGDSIVSVADEDLIKIHVHTNDPGNAMQKALTIGQLVNIKVDNMREEHNERIGNVPQNDSSKVEPSVPAADVPMKEHAFVAVSVGEGINKIFESLGVDYIVTGGQTMNPSTEDFLKAVESIHAKNIYIFPNNKNIILAASQVVDLVEDKHVFVIPTKTVPQGVSSLIVFDAGTTPEDNVEVMTEALADVKTGQVTFAVRDTSIDNREIKEGDILGISDSGIAAVEKSVEESTLRLLDQMLDEDSELVTIYYGEDATEEDAQKIAEYVEAKFDEAEVEIHYGGQPLYYYIISVE
jgi:DAK2 domain fusion protein YloV